MNVKGEADTYAGRRGWQVVKKDVDDLKAVKDARSVSFVDMDEDVSASELCVSTQGWLTMCRER